MLMFTLIILVYDQLLQLDDKALNCLNPDVNFKINKFRTVKSMFETIIFKPINKSTKYSKSIKKDYDLIWFAIKKSIFI